MHAVVEVGGQSYCCLALSEQVIRRGIWKSDPPFAGNAGVGDRAGVDLSREIDLGQSSQHVLFCPVRPGCRSRGDDGGVERYPVSPCHRRRQLATPTTSPLCGGLPGGQRARHSLLSEQPGAHLVQLPLWHLCGASTEQNPRWRGRNSSSPSSRLIAEQVGRAAAAAIAAGQRQALALALSDPLTGLPNRRA